MYRTRVRRSVLFHHVAFSGLWLLALVAVMPAQTPRSTPPQPTCETACRVNPVTAPKECDCFATAPPPSGSAVVVGGQPGTPTPGPGAEPPPGAPATDGIIDLILASYEREVAGIDSYYYVETMDIVPRPTVRFLEKKVEAGRSVFREVSPAELGKREQLADPTLSADQREIAKRPQALLGGYADALDFLAKGLGAGKLAKPLTDGLRGVEADLDADKGNLQAGTDDVGGLLGEEALELFKRNALWSQIRSGIMDVSSPLMPSFRRTSVPNVLWDGLWGGSIVGPLNMYGYQFYPCSVLSLPPKGGVVEGFPHRLVSAEMWVCVLARGVAKPVRTRVEYVTNAGDASPADLIVGGTQTVVIDQISFDHRAVGNMYPAHKLVQSISGMSDALQVVRKIRQGFTVNKTPTQAEIAKLIGEALGARPQ